MAILTEKLGLVKPEIDDMITPTIFADNFDKIDSEFGKKGNFFTYDESSSKLQLRSGGETGIILSEVEISGGNSGGSGNGKSIILPPNPIVNVAAGSETMTLTWTKPDSEVKIKKYNIYISETQPSSLSDMTLQGSTTELTYVLEGLVGGKTYYISVQAVSIYMYENASISNVKNGTLKALLLFICVGASGKSYYSTDGTSWAAMSRLDNSVSYYNSVTYGNGRFVCVGDSGKSYYSTDGTSWTAMSGLDSSYDYASVAYGNGRFVCVGSFGETYYSTDGLTWAAMSGISSSKICYGVTYGNGRFVCVCANGYSYYSTDGLTWNAMDGLGSDQCKSVTYGNDRFVCVCESGKSYYSTNGTSWTAMSGLESATYNGVTYGNGRFVCVGDSGKSYYSTNGTSWTAMSGLISTLYNGVTYSNGRFVCVGNSGKSYYSTDGLTWTAMSGLDESTNYYGVCGN